jgi:Mg-chelatase subunit ChlD
MTNNKPSTPQSITTTSDTTTANALLRKHSVSLPGLHARLRNPKVDTASDPNTKPNRLALLLDVSGSMRGKKIQSLRDAVTSFIQSCTFGDTALALEPFGESADPPSGRVPLSCFAPFLTSTVQTLQSYGSTPMAEAMDYVLRSYSLTRSVLVSDGEPDSEARVFDQAMLFHEAALPCDCVHIGNSTDGESCLRRVAEITGGQYIKFTDIQSFAKSFKYLTPAYYAMLCDGSVSAAQLGAKELKSGD